MKIVIIGAGNVGKYITKNLAKEGHDIIIIDTDYDSIEQIVNEYNVKGICGNGVLSDIQIEADVEHADLVISATSYDEMNVITSLVAKSLGASTVIARLRKIEYNRQYEFMRKNFGIDLLINPEKETALKIAELLRFPYALNVTPFADGVLNGLTIKVPNDSTLIGLKVGDIEDVFDINVVIYAVQKDDKIIIPDEDYIIQANDLISILAKEDVMKIFAKKVGFINSSIKNVMIVGGGRLAYYLAQALTENKISVKVVEQDKQICDEISANMSNVSLVLSEENDYNTLQEIGLENVDSFVTLSNDDKENLVLSLFAKSHNIPNIIARIEDEKISQIASKIGLTQIISTKTETALKIIKYTRSLFNMQPENSTLISISKLLNEKSEVIEFDVDENPKIINTPLKKLNLVKDVVIACILRGKEIIIPNNTDELIVGDKIIVISKTSQLSSLEDILR